jgi:hypothetical protein
MFALVFETSFGYRIMGLLHIASVVAAFGPMLVYPSLRRSGQNELIARLHMRITMPALVLLWVLGMGLAGIAELKLADLWLAGSVVLWALLMGTSWFLIRPATSDPSESATGKLMAGTGITHLGLVVGLVLMIWKPVL